MRHSSLRTAIGSNDLDALERLLAEGAAPDDGDTPTLLEDAISRDQGRMARRLIEAGADVKKARLALNYAAERGDVGLVEILLRAGALERESNHDMGADSPQGFPLACAARGGSLPCVKLLSSRLARGDGHTEALIEIAIGIGIDAHDRIDAERRVQTLEMVDHLTSLGGDPTGLAHATVSHTSQVWLLEKALDTGASVDAVVTSQGRTLLHVAANLLKPRMLAVCSHAVPIARRGTWMATRRSSLLSRPPRRRSMTLRRGASA